MKISIADFFYHPGESAALAPVAESLGYERYWLGEHHAVGQWQCPNPIMVATILAGLTSQIRVGTGAIGLSYQSPYRVAEDARICERLFPGRMDLGVTRGLVPSPHQGLQRAVLDGRDPRLLPPYDRKVVELHKLLTGRMDPGDDLKDTLPSFPGPPMWLMGMSPKAGAMAGELGVGFCSSFHHGGTVLSIQQSFEAYRAAFRPSPELAAPHAIALTSCITHPDPATREALHQRWKPAVASAEGASALATAAWNVGAPEAVAARVRRQGEAVGADEMMLLDHGGARCLEYGRTFLIVMAQALGLTSRGPLPEEEEDRGVQERPGTCPSTSTRAPTRRARRFTRCDSMARRLLAARCSASCWSLTRARLQPSNGRSIVHRINYFQQLGESVAARWRAKSFDEAAFPEVAASALRESKPSDNVDPLEILREFQSNWTVPQMDGSARFGQPPITVYYHPLFYIDVYYWLDGTTSIHQHAFSGAFHVLEGASVHSQYQFDLKHRVNTSLLLGNLRLASVNHLQVGDTQEIIAGRGMIHSLFHLDRPSCTVVIRTLSEAIGLPQYDYFAPHIAEAPRTRDQLTSRRKAFSLLKELDADGYRATMLSALSHATFFEAYATILEVRRSGSLDDFALFADECRRVHGPLMDLVVASLEETDRRDKLAVRRQTITQSRTPVLSRDADQRAFS